MNAVVAGTQADLKELAELLGEKMKPLLKTSTLQDWNESLRGILR